MKNIMINFLWKFGERISAQIVSLVVSIVLARLLAPNDYGAIAIIMVFISIADVLVARGFSSALIQKKDADDLDFSSVFYFTLGFSIILYLILFICAPMIARWYAMPILSPTLRVLGLRIIIGSINSVQQAYVSRHMLFRKFFLSTLGGVLVSAFFGIVLAYNGFGIWALVIQYLTNTTMGTIVLAVTVDWKPKFVFSVKRLLGLLSFGWKILASALVGSVYDNCRSLIIGKKYSNSDLAYYSKGQQFPQLIMDNINTSITSVLFPVFSNMQDDKEKLAKATKLSVQITLGVIAPAMIGLAAVGDLVIKLLLTDKWSGCVPYLQISCIFYLISAVYIAYLQSYKALGNSGLSLVMETSDAVIGLILVALLFRKGVMMVAVTALISRFIALMICIPINKKLLGLKMIDQVKDILLPVILSIFMALCINLLNNIEINYILLLVVKICMGASIYLLLSFVIKSPVFILLGKVKK